MTAGRYPDPIPQQPDGESSQACPWRELAADFRLLLIENAIGNPETAGKNGRHAQRNKAPPPEDCACDRFVLAHLPPANREGGPKLDVIIEKCRHLVDKPDLNPRLFNFFKGQLSVPQPPQGLGPAITGWLVRKLRLTEL